MASISTMLPEQCVVVRDGQRLTIEGRDIVPGDLLSITMGNKLPADVRFVQASSDARFDRSILTGEAAPLLASVDSTDSNYLETACIGLAGTHCVSGTATGVVVNTGDNTVFGRVGIKQIDAVRGADLGTDRKPDKHAQNRNDATSKGNTVLCLDHNWFDGIHGHYCHHRMVG